MRFPKPPGLKQGTGNKVVGSNVSLTTASPKNTVLYAATSSPVEQYQIKQWRVYREKNSVAYIDFWTVLWSRASLPKLEALFRRTRC